MVEYLIRLLISGHRIGVLSRGYGRSTTGYLRVEQDAAVADVGDEPLQVKRKFPDVFVAVSEDRLTGISLMLAEQADLEVILLDDAFQHRSVLPALSLLLTSFNRPYWSDSLLPAGRLREPLSAIQRADAVVITKCPENLSANESERLRRQARLSARQHLFFSSLKYGKPYGLFGGTFTEGIPKTVILLTGIADAEPLVRFVKQQYPQAEHVAYRDHFRYRKTEVDRLIRRLHHEGAGSSLLLTTEKDGMRLLAFREELQSSNVEPFCIPVELTFDAAQKTHFDELIFSFVPLRRNND